MFVYSHTQLWFLLYVGSSTTAKTCHYTMCLLLQDCPLWWLLPLKLASHYRTQALCLPGLSLGSQGIPINPHSPQACLQGCLSPGLCRSVELQSWSETLLCLFVSSWFTLVSWLWNLLTCLVKNSWTKDRTHGSWVLLALEKESTRQKYKKILYILYTSFRISQHLIIKV